METTSPVDPPELFLTRAEARSIDQAAVEQLGLPSLLLMENAAAGANGHLLNRQPAGQIVILCGPGNNGGDGLAMARQLAAEARTPSVHLITGAKPLSSDCQSNLEFLVKGGVDVQVVDSPNTVPDDLSNMTEQDWIVDSLLGTGMRGVPQAPFRQWIEATNASAAKVLAIDVPSGLNCDDGSWSHCTQADLTVTFVAQKIGYRQPSAAACLGEVAVTGIGLPDEWVRRWIWTLRESAAVNGA